MNIIAKKYRGNLVDLVHRGNIVVSDYRGNILYSYGDYNKNTFARSATKPMQCIPVIESGALEMYNITQKELSVICSSHNAEYFHVNAIRNILSKAGLDENYLQCGSHYPMAQYVEDEFKYKNIQPTNIHSDCSGKHAGMLITAKFYNESLTDYYKEHHPVQKRILTVLSEVCDYDINKILIALDGCGVPVHAMPLNKFAQGYGRMAKPKIFKGDRCNAINLITSSMTMHPEMVAGTDRFCTDIMSRFGDRLFAKSGANGFYSIGLKNEGIGIAVKVEDGSSEIIPAVILEILTQIGVLTKKESLSLEKYNDYNIYNFKKEIVGNTKICLKLKTH